MAEHRGATDKKHPVKLEGRIERAHWLVARAAAGTPAKLRVATRFVGEGAPVSIEVKTVRGKKVGKLDGEIWTSEFEGEFPLPKDLEDEVQFEVQLKKHKLKATSDTLRVVPAQRISDARWDRAEARRGDQLVLTATVGGVPDGTRLPISIWEHDEDGSHDLITRIEGEVRNGKLEAKWEYEYHEDTDEIPTAEETEKGYQPPEYFFRVEGDGVSADSGLLEFKDWVDLSLKIGDKPAADEEYVLTLPDGSERKGKLDADGKAVERDIPPGAFTVKFPRLARGEGGG